MKGVRILVSCILFALTFNVGAQSQSQSQESSFIVNVIGEGKVKT